jgi:predicted aspartyl protease
MDAVKKVGSEELGFFQVKLDNTRVEYFVLSVDKKGKRLVGMKAIAVES